MKNLLLIFFLLLGCASSNVPTTTVTPQANQSSGSAFDTPEFKKSLGKLLTKGGSFNKNGYQVVGAMDPDIIKGRLKENVPKFRECFQSEIDKGQVKKHNIIVLLHFEINKYGTVSPSNVEGRDANLTMKSCIKNHLDQIKFPKPLGGGKVMVKQPVNLYR